MTVPICSMFYNLINHSLNQLNQPSLNQTTGSIFWFPELLVLQQVQVLVVLLMNQAA